MIVIQHNSLIIIFCTSLLFDYSFYGLDVYKWDGGLLEVDYESTRTLGSQHQGMDRFGSFPSKWSPSCVYNLVYIMLLILEVIILAFILNVKS